MIDDADDEFGQYNEIGYLIPFKKQTSFSVSSKQESKATFFFHFALTNYSDINSTNP